MRSAASKVGTTSFWMAAAALLLVACGTPKGVKDGGSTGGGLCELDTDCADGEMCIGNVCQDNSCDVDNSLCPDGYYCDALTLQCKWGGGGGGDGGTSTDGGNPNGTCSGRCDCTGDNEICVAGKCQVATSDSCVRDDQCPLGTICDFNRKCVPGCAAACDCAGGKICNTTTLQCESCSRTNPCPDGESCNANGECVAATQCSSTTECADGQVCKGGACGFCSQDAECAAYGTEYICGSSGLCISAACSDQSCQAQLGSPRAYCDTNTNACDLHECVSNSDCVSPAVCDLATKTCSGSCDFQTCQATCQAQGLVCSSASCSCQAGGTRTGNAVLPDGSPCDFFSCLVGGCVDSGDPTYMCQPGGIECIFGGFFGIALCL